MKTRRINLAAQNNYDLVLKYLHLLKPINNFSDAEISVASKLIYKNDLSLKTRSVVREDLEMTKTTFNVILHRLKKKGFIVNNVINPFFIPIYDNEGLTLTFNITLNAEKS
jgi:DNA-binding MarR family transcriptional regulator